MIFRVQTVARKMKTETVPLRVLKDITGNGQQVTFSSIIDNGDGTFLTAMVQSAFHQTGTGDGSSIGDVKYPDSVWVAKMDKDLNVLKVYRDDRISYAAGQYRAQVLH